MKREQNKDDGIERWLKYYRTNFPAEEHNEYFLELQRKYLSEYYRLTQIHEKEDKMKAKVKRVGKFHCIICRRSEFWELPWEAICDSCMQSHYGVTKITRKWGKWEGVAFVTVIYTMDGEKRERVADR
jgi:hypothetical protein